MIHLFVTPTNNIVKVKKKSNANCCFDIRITF